MSKGNAISRMFRAVWSGLNGVRKVLHLILLLVIFSVLIGLLSTSAPSLPAQAALVIRPAGNLVEQLEGDPFERALSEMFGDARPQTLVQDVIDGLEFARDDNRIKAVVLELNELDGAGLSKLQRIGEALDDFRVSGKPVIARADNYSQAAYYLASRADEVYLHPEGIFLLPGFGIYNNYYREAIEKLKIDWNVFRVGTHKAAVEPFVRDDMSAENREAMTELLNQMWTSYQDDVHASRELGDGALDELMANLLDYLRSAGGNIADVALEYGLVDELLTREQVAKRVAQYAGSDPDSVEPYHMAELADYVARMRLARGDTAKRQNIAVITAAGEILDGVQPPGTIGGDSTADLLKAARIDDSVKAVVLRVDSPGGSAFASEVIRNEIEALQQSGKPVIASMGSVAASGGYWISMAADRIYASPTTITGSIGVFGMFPTFQRSLDALGINTDGVGSTKWTGELRIDRQMSDDAKALFQIVVEDGYRDFIGKVARFRDIPVEAVDRIAQGQVWTGAQALEHGLVDELGGLEQAIEAAAELADLDKNERGIIYFEKELTPAEQFALEFMGSARAIGLDLSGLFSRHAASAVERLADTVLGTVSQTWRFNDPKGIYAYCFCTFE